MAFGPNPPPIQAHICVRDGEAALSFYEKAFGAATTYKVMADDGKRILHANMAVHGGEVMLHDEFPEFNSVVPSPAALNGTTFAISINLPEPVDVDAAIAKAAAAGAEVILPPGDMFWGARYGRVKDLFGHVWAFNAPLGNNRETKVS